MLAPSVLVVPAAIEAEPNQSVEPDTVPFGLLDPGEPGADWFQDSEACLVPEVEDFSDLDPRLEETLVLRDRQKRSAAGLAAGFAGAAFLGLLAYAAIADTKVTLPSSEATTREPLPRRSAQSGSSAAVSSTDDDHAGSASARTLVEPAEVEAPQRSVTREDSGKPPAAARPARTRARPGTGKRARAVRKRKGAPTTTRNPGFLSLGSKPPCRIYIDGKFRGMTPRRSLPVAPGVRNVVLKSEDGRIKRSFRVRIRSRQTVRVVKNFLSS